MSFLATFALIAGLTTALAPLAQARRIVRRQSSDDISLWWLWLYGAGCLVWLAYGISIASVPLIATQAIAVVTAGTAAVLGLRFRRRAEHGSPLRRVGRLFGARSAAPVRDITPAVSAELVVEEARRRYFIDTDGERALPVVDASGRAVGILRASAVAALPASERASRLVADLADRDPALIADSEPRLAVRAVFALERRRHVIGSQPRRCATDGDGPRTRRRPRLLGAEGGRR